MRAGRADQRLAAADEDELAARLEVAVLVEDAVVGQELLAVHRLHLAVDADGAGVEEIPVEVGGADERRQPLGLVSDLVERPGCGPHEEEVLGRVARRRELGEEHELGARGARLLEAGDDPVAIPVQIADHRVHLRECKAHQS